LYYWKDHRGREVDFILKRGNRIVELIQVSYISGKGDINKREIDNLTLASKELNCTTLTVITWDHADEEVKEGKTIRYIPLWKWLLNSGVLS
ncbi:hypothetical protein B1A_19423, partial [mine drainage metagenome]